MWIKAAPSESGLHTARTVSCNVPPERKEQLLPLKESMPITVVGIFMNYTLTFGTYMTSCNVVSVGKAQRRCPHRRKAPVGTPALQPRPSLYFARFDTLFTTVAALRVGTHSLVK